MWKDCNHRYHYSHYNGQRYRGAASWKAAVLVILVLLGSFEIWVNIFAMAVYLENGILLILELLVFLGNICYMEYIFIKYTCMRKYGNIDEQMRKEDVLSCLYYGNLFSIIICSSGGTFFCMEVMKDMGDIRIAVVSFLIAIVLSIIYMIPIVREVTQE